eukprot:scaffold70096_cov75-Phaeocystis_antarctica.AAC.8
MTAVEGTGAPAIGLAAGTSQLAAARPVRTERCGAEGRTERVELVMRAWSTTPATQLQQGTGDALATHAGDRCVLWLSLVLPGPAWMRARQNPPPPR